MISKMLCLIYHSTSPKKSLPTNGPLTVHLALMYLRSSFIFLENEGWTSDMNLAISSWFETISCEYLTITVVRVLCWSTLGLATFIRFHIRFQCRSNVNLWIQGSQKMINTIVSKLNIRCHQANYTHAPL